MLAYAPYWLGILILIPYFGLMVERGLKGYVFLVLIVTAQSVAGAPFMNAVITAGVAMLLELGVEVVIGRPMTRLADKLVYAIGNVKDRRTVRDLYAEFASKNPVR